MLALGGVCSGVGGVLDGLGVDGVVNPGPDPPPGLLGPDPPPGLLGLLTPEVGVAGADGVDEVDVPPAFVAVDVNVYA